MNVIAYAARPYEADPFERYAAELGIALTCVPQNLSLGNAHLAHGFECVTILSACDAGAAVLEILAAGGTRFVAARTAGHDNIDAEAARRVGIRFSNANYSPNSVADFAVMLILMSIRKAKTIITRNNAQDYTIVGSQGREMRNLTIGLIGTGRIGAATARNLYGFDCCLLGYDVRRDPALENLLTYVELDELLAESDVISLHAPLTADNRHLINARTIARMKDGVIIVNCARGDLIDTEALIEAIEEKKVSAAALDVIENERGLFHADHRHEVLKHRQLAILRAFPNVVVTTHNAFFTDQAVSDMVEVGLRSLASFVRTGESPWELRP
ncbi:D-isomer specific 2-hydroxyacid dehydrogenase family protein [Rhodoplanes roseus]|uniref:Lactate dehydrogenase n=2 Tax=Rhodoplanes TaxID=29407 RepID=A0A327L6G4_9BRAD|nr:D-isomer specific 2-hydroxyacid dehydrogenase family protein [Rhodoplanes roseus]RAI45112.1 lactate dehydrogenase [Rhodoplanes roseus]